MCSSTNSRPDASRSTSTITPEQEGAGNGTLFVFPEI
jgi:hypothetical protein